MLPYIANVVRQRACVLHDRVMGGDRLHHIQRFYSQLQRLERRSYLRRLTGCNGRMNWPQRGVYFFFEDGEVRSHSGTRPRIVRIGTHALKPGSQTLLWTRLSQHRGRAGSGSGSHRGSIFRLIVGTALMERERAVCPSWDDDKPTDPLVKQQELQLEMAVSRIIGAMPFLWLDIGDEPGPESLRRSIERNSIALLSNFGKPPIDPPSANWLGHACNRPRVRASGLWNSDHVDQDYDPAFLDAFVRLIDNLDPLR